MSSCSRSGEKVKNNITIICSTEFYEPFQDFLIFRILKNLFTHQSRKSFRCRSTILIKYTIWNTIFMIGQIRFYCWYSSFIITKIHFSICYPFQQGLFISNPTT